ncbi:MAG TPA: hypothetical protein VL133_17215, partial [Devosia sp.]|nr:hypothetical protein [Devosia sp.]
MRIWLRRYPAIIAALLGPLLALVLLATPVNAQPASNPTLDALFAQLRVAPDAASAKAIDQQIWMEWVSPDDPDLMARMQVALVELSTAPTAALADFQAIAADYPDYAEAWNQLATLHFMLGDYTTSLTEIDR